MVVAAMLTVVSGMAIKSAVRMFESAVIGLVQVILVKTYP